MKNKSHKFVITRDDGSYYIGVSSLLVRMALPGLSLLAKQSMHVEEDSKELLDI